MIPVPEDEAPEGSGEGGMERLPLLAIVGVPAHGFHTLMSR